MPILQLTSAGLIIDHVFVAIPGASLADITALLQGKPRRTRKKHNDIYTWDAHGIYVHCAPKSTIVQSLAVDLETRPSFDFSPHAVFAGTLNWADETFVPPGDARLGLQFATREATKQPQTLKNYLRMTIGALLVDCVLDDTGQRLISIQISGVPVTPAKLVPLVPRKGNGVTFVDFNFKLMVMQELMYRRGVLQPRFDVYDFVKRFEGRKINISHEGFDVIPEVRRYFEAYPLPAALLSDIECLAQDGGDDIYLQVCPLWDGQDSTFNIRNADDAATLPKLNKVVLFYDEREAVLQDFKNRGIAASFGR